MNALKPNPVTGFLESVNPSTLEAFTSDKKIRFLELAKIYADRRELPDTHKILEAIGIKHSCLNEHLSIDEKFKDAWNEIRRSVASGMANELSIKAKGKQGIIANLAVLKYLETGSWLNDQRLIVNGDSGQLKTAIHRNKDFIDAEIVQPNQISDGKPS
jgi:hypothetical protein